MTTSESKREENNRLKKTLIIETAMSMIERDGAEAFNMKSLAECSGVPRPTLYRFYTSKEQVFHDMAVYWGMGFTNGVSVAKKSRSLDKALNETFKAILTEAQSRPELFKVVLAAIFYERKDAADFQSDFAQLFFALLRKVTDLDVDAMFAKQHKEGVNVILRLLLANMQLLVTDRVSLSEAQKNLSYCVSALLNSR